VQDKISDILLMVGAVFSIGWACIKGAKPLIRALTPIVRDIKILKKEIKK